MLSSEDGGNEQQKVIIKSYSVLEPVVKKLNLDIIAEPKLFPIIGKKLFYNYNDSNDAFAKPFLGLTSFAWGGESIQVSKFSVPNILKNSKFIITYLGNGQYSLKDSSGVEILKGKVNKDLKVFYDKDLIEINISEIKARAGTEFKIVNLLMDDAIAAILQKLDIVAAGKKTDIITLSFKGDNPEKITIILNTIAESAVYQDVHQKQEQARKTLEFLRAHEPTVRADLAKAETVLHNYRAKSGNVALDQETKITMENIALLQNQISQLLIQKGQLEQKYTSNSLQIKDAETTLLKLQQEKEKYEKKLKQLPDADQIALNLMRNVEIQNQIYVNLVEKIQQYELLKAGTVGDIAVVSYAHIPLKSTNISAFILLILSFVIGVFLSIALIIVRKLLWTGIESPDIIENKFELPNIATLHNSKIHIKQLNDFEKGRINYLSFLAEVSPYDLTVEGLKSLRTNFLFQFSNAKNNIISITGPLPGVGKSFVSANLSYSLAEAGKKILLIDGDVRKGDITNYIDKNIKHKGLCDYLKNEVKIDEIIAKTRINNLDFIPKGEYNFKNSTYLLSDKLQELLNFVSPMYDFIIIDTAPVLAVTDSIYFCKLSAVSLVVFGFEKHDENEIGLTIKKLEKAGVNLDGFIFNKVNDKQSYYGNKYTYGYKYVKV